MSTNILNPVWFTVASVLIGEEPFLLFANRHDLRELRLYSGNYHLIVEGQKSIIALDYDFTEKLLFWSDVATERISM